MKNNMEYDEKAHCIAVLIENVLYSRLAATDKDDRISDSEKIEAKKRYIKEFIINIPTPYKDVENIGKIVKTVLTRMNQYVEWEEKTEDKDEER